MVDIPQLEERLMLMEQWHVPVDDWRDFEIALFQAFIDKQDEVVSLQREALQAGFSLHRDDVLRRIADLQRELEHINRLREQCESDLIEARTVEENRR